MSKKTELTAVLDSIKNLNEAEKSILAERILAMLSETETPSKNTLEKLCEKENANPNCPHCGAMANIGCVVKRGFDKGRQRYFCKSCGKHFFATTNTALAHSRKDADTWQKFISLTITGASLKTCCAECHIAYQTAFTWRHKILNAFRVHQDATMMTGRVEMDEMLIPISYKGNHSKSKKFVMPRPAYKRGSDNKSKSSKDKACVFCMIENGNKKFYASVPGIGFMSNKMLDNTVSKHVNKDSALILADNYKVTHKYLQDNGYNYRTLLSNNTGDRNCHKPEICGEQHIQHVNSMHRHLRLFLAKYYGVSTKYLENYVAL